MNAGRFGEGSNMLFKRKCEPASWMPNGAVKLDEHFHGHSGITTCLNHHGDQLEGKALKSLSGGMKLAQIAHQKHWRWHVWLLICQKIALEDGELIC